MKESVSNKLKKRMEETGADAVIVTPSSNMEYLIGDRMMADERFSALVIPVKGEPFIFANQLYRQGIFTWNIKHQIFWKDGEDVFERFAEFVKERIGVPGALGVEKNMPAGFLMALEKVFPVTRFLNNERILGELRKIKKKKEIYCMREACRRCSEALREVLGQTRAWIGRTEGEFSDALCRAMEKREISQAGALVCAGENAAMPHYTGRDGIIHANEGLLVDFGGRYHGYWSDMSRTFFFSSEESQDTEFLHAYETVLQAVKQGVSAAKPGKRMEEVDRACRNVIQNAGYGEFFVHRTGHGIGLDNHEEPCAVQGEKSIVEEGMTFSVEPGIYIPGKFGIRIEEQVLISSRGAECLHDFTRKLIIF